MESKAPRYIMCKEEATACDKDNGKDGSIPVRNEYPLHPINYVELPNGIDRKKAKELRAERYLLIARSTANDIIIPDPSPKWVRDIFFDKFVQLDPILEKDDVQCFLQFFKSCAGRGMSWDFSITARTLIVMISYNALRCAKVILEGEAPELYGMHANPNCINSLGFFPLHEAAERFSVDMIELLLRHGASANVRTVGNGVIEDLLPLHVAVENTCLHKYLEDNLSPSQNHLDYIYKLIYLLCLPEMKIFLDTIRLLAEKTNNLLQELWNYVENGKLIQSAVLLLAAQEQIRGGCSSKINGSSKKDGFEILSSHILRLSLALRWEEGTDRMTQKRLEERRILINCAGQLVDVISHAGEPLSAYIQAHSEVPHMEVLEHVSSILKEYGFCPTAEVMDSINLRPYDCKTSDRESSNKGIINANRPDMETANLHAEEEKVAGKEVGGGWDPTYTRRSYFPYWRSVLRARCPMVVYPAYARQDPRSGLEQFHVSRSSPKVSGSTPTANHKLGLVRRLSSPVASHQPKRNFSIAAIGAFRLLKMLKHA